MVASCNSHNFGAWWFNLHEIIKWIYQFDCFDIDFCVLGRFIQYFYIRSKTF